MEIKDNEHVFIAGMTGSGKTYLAEQYINGFDNVVVLDTKGFFNWESSPDEVKVFETFADLQSMGKGKAIYRPIFQELNIESYDRFFEWIYLRRNTVVVIDELMEVAPSPRTYPIWLKGLLTRGRQLGISVFSLTQRPRDIPIIAMSEATHFFIFRLNLEEDRERVAKITGYDIMKQNAGQLKDYIFWYFNNKLDQEPVRARLKTRKEG